MPKWFSGDVVANGIVIHYHRTAGHKPPIVLSHGFSDNGLCWVRAARALEMDYDVIMPDARGHGLSDAPQDGYADTDHAADLAGFIQALGLERPALAGHSMGASTTAMTAVQYPDLVGCAILEDPPWFEGEPPRARQLKDLSPKERKARAEQHITQLIEQKSKPLEEIAAFGRKQSPTWDEIEFGPWAQSKQQLSPRTVAVTGRKRTHWSEIVSHIKCPTLLVIGDPEQHSIVTPETAQKVSETNPLIEVVQLKGAGHNIRREQFEGFIAAVSTFLAKH
jgi:pimeloyl-ACP methyl ester carboxylesterase